jgi:hypothetical protein
MLLFLFPKIKSALKGTRFDSADAVKAKVTEVMKKLSEKYLQHCFNSGKSA